MADVALKYKGATIGELSESGRKTIETAGKYCEADISLEYVKPSGGDTSGLSYSSSIIVPTNEIGRLANGGYPKAMEFFKSLLPSNFVFARLKLDESEIQNVPNYFLYELTFAVLIKNTDSNLTPVFVKRILNGAIDNISITAQPSGWSVIISPDYSYKLEIWSE